MQSMYKETLSPNGVSRQETDYVLKMFPCFVFREVVSLCNPQNAKKQTM